MTPDPTPRPPDHGAAGFCTDHTQPVACPRCAHPSHPHRMCACEFDWIGQQILPCGCDFEPPTAPQPVADERVETVDARLARHALDDEPLDAVEVESIRAGRCGPLLYGGPCWLMPGHVGPHHCYREDIAAVVAALDPEEPR